MAKQTLDIWTLYRNPTDRTREWVVRLFEGDKPTKIMFEADAREECEAHVLRKKPGAVFLSRMPGDDPVIVGTWI